MTKLKQNGYFRLRISDTEDRWLHFSMVCWIELQKDTGLDINSWANGFEALSEFDQLDRLADLVYASAKAYDLEEGYIIGYNKYNAINWTAGLSEKDTAEFIEAMTHSVKTPDGLGKTLGAKIEK